MTTPTPERATCPACAEPMDIALTRMGYGVHPTCEPLPVDARTVAAEALAFVTDADANSPRSRQTAIGPSQVDHPCDTWVALKVAGVDPVNPRGTSWAAIVGTATHEWVGNAVAHAEVARYTDHSVSPRWHVEERVTVGEIDGQPVTGSCDLYDGHTGTVVDWKVVATPRAVAMAKEPPRPYRVQAHLYGRGFAAAGLHVRTVALVFIRRDGGEPCVWSEPYDETVAVEALARVSAIAKSVRLLGVETTAAALPMTRHYCDTCDYFQRNTTSPRACPGVPASPPPTLAGLLN